MEDSVFVRILAAFLGEARGCLLPVYVKVVVDWSKGWLFRGSPHIREVNQVFGLKNVTTERTKSLPSGSRTPAMIDRYTT